MIRIIFLIFLTLLSVTPSFAQRFAYSYEGQQVTYDVIDEDERTVQTYSLNSHYSNYNYKGKLIIPATVKDGDKEYTVVRIDQTSFKNCQELTSVEIPNTVQTIGTMAFAISGLKEVKIGRSVKTIANEAFYACKLDSVYIPNSVTSIEREAFEYNSNLKKVIFEDGTQAIQFEHPGAYDAQQSFYQCPIESIYLGRNLTYQWVADAPFAGITTIRSVIVGDYVSYLSGGLFNGCTDLENIRWGASLREIGNYTFNKCTSLREIAIPNTVVNIGEYAFNECDKLSSLKLSNSLKTIGAYAFNKCSITKELILPESLTSIGEKAFYDIKEVSEIRIPDSITTIEPSAFGHNLIKKLIIGNGVQTIGANAFSYASVSGVDELIIGKSVTYIGTDALAVESSKGKVTCYAVDPPAVTYGSFGMNQYSIKNPVLYVPAESIKAYQTHKYWPLLFKSIREIPIPAESVSINLDEWNAKVGDEIKLSAEVYPENSTDKYIRWKSNNDAVATVGADGMVKAFSVGSAVITATAGSVSSTCNVNVTSNVTYDVSLNLYSVSLFPAETIKLIATISPIPASNKLVTWSSSDKTVATVSEDGTVTAVGVGSAVIAVAFEGQGAVCNITVKPVPVTRVVLDSSYLQLSISETVKMNVTILPENATEKTLIWSSDDDNIVTVDETGLVTGRDIGRTFIQVKCGELSDKCEVEVFKKGVTGIKLEQTSLTLQGATQIQLKADVTPEDTTVPIKWESSNDLVLTVNESGLLTTHAPGDAVVTVSCGRYSDNCEIEVLDVEPIFTISPKEATMRMGETLQLIVTVEPENAFNKEIYFESSDEEVAQVDKNGLVTALSEGEVEIECRGAVARITVLPAIVLPTHIYFDSEDATMEVGETIKLNAKFLPENVTDKTIVWNSDDDSVATVDASGNITAKKQGCAFITATTVNGKKATFIVLVVAPDEEDEKIADIEVDGILYNLSIAKRTASVSISNQYTGISKENLIIPEYIEFEGLPYKVISIEAYAFNCMAIFENWKRANIRGNIKLPSTLKTIGSHAFANCNLLTGDLIIPDSVTEIGGCAFTGCSGLKGNLIIGSSVEIIGADAFSGTGFTGSLVIPDSVTEIGPMAFHGCHGFTGNLIIGCSVKIIGESAFGAYSPSDISWDGGDGNGFTGSLIIPDSVIEIGESAFRRCRALSGNLILGSSISIIGDRAFEDCSGFTGTLVIPETVLKIGDFSFSGCMGFVDSLIISNSITSIGKATFSGCSGLSSISLPSSVSSIGEKAFSGCTGLKSLTLPNSVTSIGVETFLGCTGLTSITIPPSVSSIREKAFSGCTGLESLTLPNSISTIYRETFSGCTRLASVTIPPSVSSIRDEAFSGCTGLTSISIPDAVTEIEDGVFSGCIGLTSIIIPNSVTSIGWSAFSGCTGLTSITIPNTVTTIRSYAFSGCTGLSSIIIPDSIIQIESGVFSRCTGLTAITIPNSVTSIGMSAFSGCTGLTSITIPNSVTSIGFHAFSECNGLTSIILPNSETEIGDYAFSDCTGLTSIIVPPSVSEFGSYAFEDCKSLISIVIGFKTRINQDNFIYCPNISDIFRTSPIPWGYGRSFPNATLHVQDESVREAYMNSANSPEFKSITTMTVPNTLTADNTSIRGNAGETFQLTAILEPEDVTLPYIFWRSTNPEIATVDHNGLVTIHKDDTMEPLSDDGEEPQVCKIIAETLYYNGPIAEVYVNSKVSTGVDNIIEDGEYDLEADVDDYEEVYNINGIRVADSVKNLKPGIYIIRRGTEVKKIIVK